MSSWWSIIIPSIVSIIGFIVTIFITYNQFKNAKKERITERQSKLYLECYKKIEQIINLPQIIFDKKYYESILFFKAEMKLCASNNTLRIYRAYLKFVFYNLEKYNVFYKQNDPTSNNKNTEVIIDENTGETSELLHFTENDMSKFECLLENYRNQHCPDIVDIKKHIALLLNSMRKDLFNEPIENDVIQ